MNKRELLQILYDKGYRRGVLVHGLNNRIERINCETSEFTIFDNYDDTYCYIYAAPSGEGGARVYEYEKEAGDDGIFAKILKCELNINTKVL